jgi:hypothetical protein
MQRHLAAGRGDAAVRQYQHLERVLERELGVEPGEAARRAHSKARTVASTVASPRIDELLEELAALASRQTAVLAELAAVGATPRTPLPTDL